MKALQLVKWKADPQFVDVDEPRPSDGEVVIRIGGAGICHSDLHAMRDIEGDPEVLPFTLGHENAGWVHEMGGGVGDLELGQPVAVYGAWGCGHCERCQQGLETLCINRDATGRGNGGMGRDGGMAEYMLVPNARLLIPLPEGLEPSTAAPLTDAGLTPYRAIKRSWSKLPPGSTAVVIGVGGLGHLAIQILKATTAARVIAVDRQAEMLSLASSCGADLTLRTESDCAPSVRSFTRGRGADVVLDFVGDDETLALGAAVVRTLGDLTIVGLGGGTLPVSFASVPSEVSVQTSFWGSRPELAEVLHLAAQGLVQPRMKHYSLKDSLAAYLQLEAGKIQGRAVVIPGG